MMNLISNEPNADAIGTKGLLKIGILAAFGVGFALGFSWFLRVFLLSGDWNQLWFIAVFALAYLVIFTLQTFFIRSNSYFALVFLLQSIALIGFFISLSTPIIVLFVVIYGMLFSASYSGRKILDNTLKVDFWNISKLVAPKGIVVMTLLVSVFVPLHLQSEGDRFPISSGVFDKILQGSTSFIQRFYPGVDTSKSLEVFARTATQQQIESHPE
ncbi:MAG TPA: hypothetical protein VF803_03170, partial [Candidatus Paceibacterota bacterium]